MRRGQQIGGYTLRAPVGEGPFGVVWEADPPPGLDAVQGGIVLKLMRPELAETPDGTAAFERLRRAVRAHQSVTHPYVSVPVGLVETPPFGVVSERHEGFPLRELEVSAQARTGQDPGELSRILFFFEELADALGQLHARKVVHGNIKPTNVLVQRGDFGIVPKLLDCSWSAIGVAASPGDPFISPEQFAGEAPTARSDQHAFGALLAGALGGEEGPSRLAEALRRMRAKDPSHRFPSMREAADALREVRSDLERTRVLDRPRQAGLLTAGDDAEGPVTDPAQPPLSAPASLPNAPRKVEISSPDLRPKGPIWFGLVGAAAAGLLLLALARGGSQATPDAIAEGGRPAEPRAPAPLPAVDAPQPASSDEAAIDRAPSDPEPAPRVEPEPEAPSPTRERDAPSSTPEPEAPSSTPEPEAPSPTREPEAPSPTPARARGPESAPSQADCDLGAARACMRAARWYGERGRDTEARDTFAVACDAGAVAGCRAAVEWWLGSGLPGADAKTRRLLAKACGLGDAGACHIAAGFFAAGRGGEAREDRARALEARACALGRGASCAAAATSTAGDQG